MDETRGYWTKGQLTGGGRAEDIRAGRQRGGTLSIHRFIAIVAFSLPAAAPIVTQQPAAPAGGTDHVITIENTGHKKPGG
jgi:hypothetical protein